LPLTPDAVEKVFVNLVIDDSRTPRLTEMEHVEGWIDRRKHQAESAADGAG
jgi:hypothetical protein